MGDKRPESDPPLQAKGVPPVGSPQPPQRPTVAPDPGQDSPQRDDSDADTGGPAGAAQG